MANIVEHLNTNVRCLVAPGQGDLRKRPETLFGQLKRGFQNLCWLYFHHIMLIGFYELCKMLI